MKTIEKNILEIDYGITCHQVNAQGVAGAGLALRLAERYPDAMKEYTKRRPAFGSCLLVEVKNSPKRLFIANLVGQMNYGREHRETHYGALAHALFDLNHQLANYLRALPVYFPYNMASGLGGGDWNVVKELIEFNFPEDYICKLPEKK